MRDHKGAATRVLVQPKVQRIQEVRLGRLVEPFCRLVEQEHRGVLDEGARQGDPPRLSARDKPAQLPGPGLEAFGQTADEIGGSGACELEERQLTVYNSYGNADVVLTMFRRE